MKTKKLVYQIVSDVLIAASLVFAVFSGTLHTEKFALAEDIGVYPYAKTFTISAYYSPLPCQNHYTTGSYEGDIRLNGGGVHGADGTNVYPGMIAAPREYPFGTKMDIPGIGIVAVHDRGGAIVSSNDKEGVFDRLDIWMGYGDEGLKRALRWGKRKVEVTVYGINDEITEQIMLSGYSSEESIPNDCSTVQKNEEERPVPPAEPTEPTEPQIIEQPKSTTKFNVTLLFGYSGDHVSQLQKELRKLNFYKAEINGVYDEITEHAVFKFQQSQGVLKTEEDLGAGVFGPKTREKLNNIFAIREQTMALISQKTQANAEIPSTELVEVEIGLN